MEESEAMANPVAENESRAPAPDAKQGNQGKVSNIPEFCLPVKSEEDVLEEQAQLMRAGVYELLARLLGSAPNSEVIESLAKIEDVSAESGEIAMGWTLLKQASLKASQKDIEDEYFSLFVGVGRGELVPFGSWYMTGYLMEKPVAVLRQDLQGLGIERESGVRESEDHIAALCDAMAILIRNGDEISFDRQKKFFSDHLEPWASTFFSDLQHAESAHFYRAVGFFGESIVKFETDYFAMQV